MEDYVIKGLTKVAAFGALMSAGKAGAKKGVHSVAKNVAKPKMSLQALAKKKGKTATSTYKV